MTKNKPNALRNFFSSPIFDDEDKTRSAYYMNIIALSNIPILLFFITIRTATGAELFGVANLILMAISTILVGVWALMKSGWVRLAGYLHVTTIWIASTMIALNGSGIRGTAFTSYFVVMLMAGLLLGWRPAIGYTALSILAAFGLANAETRGMIQYIPGGATSIATEGTVLFLFGAIFLYLIINSLQSAVRKTKINAEELQTSNKELTALRDTLEAHAQERTAILEKQAYQLQAISNVARAIASVQDINALLPEITKLISDRFGFYHVGIFLTDNNREFSLLRASNSEGGQKLFARQHKLKLDETSIVSYAISRGEPRIVLDIGTDSAHFNNPNFPDTRSELALPLRVGRNVIGALDVHSTQPNAFTEDVISTLSTLADQIAIAIENARLFSEAHSALKESEETFARYVKQEWNEFTQQAKTTGYFFDGKRIIPLDQADKTEKIKSLPQTGRLTLEKQNKNLVVPIKLRGQIIGYLDVKSKNETRKWVQDDITLLEAAAERAALALENARLVESAQRRAVREQTIGEISSKIGAVSDLESIMQAAVEELGRRIGGAAEVIVEISTDDEKDTKPA